MGGGETRCRDSKWGCRSQRGTPPGRRQSSSSPHQTVLPTECRKKVRKSSQNCLIPVPIFWGSLPYVHVYFASMLSRVVKSLWFLFYPSQ